MGRNKGQGRGGFAHEQETDVDFKIERGKVPVGKGAVAAQFLVEGEQVPGEVGASVAEVVTAAEREASDRIKRDRIPRQYQPAVKAYFSNVRRAIKELKPSAEPDGAPSDAGGKPDSNSDED